MNTTSNVTPVEIHAPMSANAMKIVWSDGTQGEVSNRLLRGLCPCASCQGHQGPIRFVPDGNEVISDIEEVGNYALRLSWGDGHSTGIYTFSYIKRLCELDKSIPDESHSIARL